MANPIPLLLLLAGLASVQSPRPVVQDAVRDPIEVRLTSRVPSEEVRLGWSPKGAKIRLSVSGAAFDGTLELGPPLDEGKRAQTSLQLSKSEGAEHLDQLWVDIDRDGRRSADEEFRASVTESRGKFWSSFEVTLQLPIGGERATRSYPMSLWYVEAPGASEPVLRWSRRGWHQGQGVAAGEAFQVLITEAKLDGVFDESDSWSLSHDPQTLVAQAPSRSLGRHAWLGERAFRVVALDPDGMWLRIAPHDPGVTRAEEEAAEDRRAVDREAARAAQPLAFGHDFDAAVARASSEGKFLLVDFEATWCGPCKEMDRWVYTAKKVVDAAGKRGVIAVKVDGDDHPDLKERFGVEAYPTMIMLDSSAAELGRKVGYVNVDDMARFLAGETGQ